MKRATNVPEEVAKLAAISIHALVKRATLTGVTAATGTIKFQSTPS